MSRLQHSYPGHIRSMQMSSTQVFVFVEGTQCDPYFFGSVCATAFDRDVRYEVRAARQLSGNTGGKESLIAFFSFLRERQSLVSDLGGQKTACIFLVDKDVDDIRRTKKRSPHLVYSQHYDVQNYVFEHGDLVKASAAAASVDPGRLQSDLGNSAQWCRRIALLWKDWVALCLCLVEDGIVCEANYRVPSRVQSRRCGPTDQEALRLLIRDIAQRAHIHVTELTERLRVSTSRVERHYARAEHHKVFKGKWFGAILADEIERIMAGDPYDKKGLAGRLPCAVAATLDFSGPWADYFRCSLRDVAKLVQ